MLTFSCGDFLAVVDFSGVTFDTFSGVTFDPFPGLILVLTGVFALFEPTVVLTGDLFKTFFVVVVSTLFSALAAASLDARLDPTGLTGGLLSSFI